jgi:N-acetylmuramic acid 6-phosphate (MurNAc-6-P) etherase
LAALEQGGTVRTAVVMEKLKISREEAERRIAEAGGRIRLLFEARDSQK